jgi:hypothetical protein
VWPLTTSHFFLPPNAKRPEASVAGGQRDPIARVFNLTSKDIWDTFNYGNESIAPPYVFDSVVLGNATLCLAGSYAAGISADEADNILGPTRDSFKP